MIWILTALVLITASVTDLLVRIGFLSMPVEYEFWPATTVLIIGIVMLLDALIKTMSRYDSKRSAVKTNTQAAYDSEINRILEEQRNMSEKKNNTAETGQVVYDEDAI